MSMGDIDQSESFIELFQSECVKNQLLDEESFLQLYSEVGPKVLTDILLSYSITLDESFEFFKKNIHNSDAEQSYKMCHKLKGSSQLVGFKRLAESCEAVCTNYKNQTPIDDTKMLKKILDEVGSIKEALIVSQNP